MKRICYLLLSSIALFASCAEDKGDRELVFAKEFAELLSKNSVDSIHALYHDSEVCDSFALDYSPDSIVVGHSGDGEFKVSFGKGKDMTMRKDADGSFTILSSHGLFAYPKDVLDFARQTGMLEDGLDDVALASRLADKEFKPWLVKNFTKQFAKILRVEGDLKVVKDAEFGMDIGVIGCKVVNNSDQVISGSDYKVVFKCVEIQQMEMNERRSSHTEPGQEIGPNGSALITMDFSDRFYPEKAYVTITLADEQLFDKYFTATGDEYAKYKEEKK